ncbi:exodeoxyribonuclease V subunit gamma [Neisseria animalis]|uniref:RecBCD enzyme subunit RecC n=1 Tax=Neisseria animalis TaxID=492 RepID=A0A5P3MVY9_NEIAN|nr:exodeoxyribonuclease V subunit gamma [Neisseria animalis]QEY24931.1 exodeoxyribonuclease V subunit gamma [Neisseria animalis]ROW33320.1 exodeoxyribonuclease V subunit gamma [Neisseria animalis]
MPESKFYLYQSNRLETLAALFCKIQQVRPLSNALAAEEIIVQSQGMRRYLSSFLARETGVAANLRFSLPAGLTWRLMREFIPGIPALSPFSPEVMRWRLLDLFRREDFQTASAFAASREALQSYLGSGDSADYQLAGQLADMFDQYLVYRPEWIDAWQAGKLLDLGDDERWQAELWRFLDDGSRSAPHRVALWEQLLGALSADKLPERFFVFGISTMAPMYLQLLQKIAEHCEVFVFALNPSEHYWGNVIEAAQILRGGDEPDLSQAGHPLLASLGKQGRDFFDFLSEIELETPVFESPFESGRDSLLHCLQFDIQTLNMPGGGQERPSANEREKLLHDGSVRIVSAHSPLRELQVLKDGILKILQEHPDWQPHDIAVLTPNIEPYSPFIEAVFGQAQGGAQALPYSLSDVKLSRRQPLLYALEQVLDLLESRFEVDKVLPLLESALVLNRFELEEDDVPLLHDAVAELNVHWGLDGEMRGEADNLFTWQQAADRLVLGWMLPEGGSGVWQNVSAWHSDVNRIGMFSRFAALLHTLAHIVGQWKQPADVGMWVQRARELVQALFLPSENDQYALQQFEQALAKWQEEAALAEFDGILPQHTVIRHLRRFLSSESQAGFLRGGITFCSMVPMRSLPFKVLCLIGLNDGDFPRNTKAAAFDLIAKHPKKGDRARRDDDRYLFLEAILSAREILYLSYVGRSIRNDDELAPSALVSELLDTVAAMTGTRSRDLVENWVVQHPLQAFSQRYFVGQQNADGLFSTRSDYAAALNSPQAAEEAFFSEPLGEMPSANEAVSVSQSELLNFWRNPVKHWLRNTLAWQEPYHDGSWESAEPFEPREGGYIADAYLEARRNHSDFGGVAAKLEAESLLPAGELGVLWQQRFQTAAKQIDQTLLDSPKQPPYAYELVFDRFILQGSLGLLHEAGQMVFQNTSLHAPAKIALMLEHLIFCAVRPQTLGEEGCRTYLVSNGETTVYPDIPPQQAREMLGRWLDYYHIGQSRPLPFFAKTSLAAAEEYLKKNDWEAAQQKALSAYRDSKGAKGQESYTEVALVFGREEQPPVMQPLFENMIVELLAPLLAAVEA